MRKIAIFFVIILIIVIVITYMYMDYSNKQNDIKKYNQVYENYLNKEINGLELASVINKSMDSNYKNNVEQDSTGKYIQNDENSINIDIKMLDDENTYNMETIFNGKISSFVSYYGDILFKCTNIEYHQNTGKVKYIIFEQVTT